MPKGPKGEKRPADVIGAAIKVAKIATGEIEEEAKPNDGKKSHTPEIQTETVPKNVRFTPKSGHCRADSIGWLGGWARDPCRACEDVMARIFGMAYPDAALDARP